ncbi:MAG TPA: peptidylprolyl isomerase [Candidatus Aenigmarchaeota archaeon]|nr:peptidylprolyl isomerase [Candidatus Aenigmarchaeota archaeon]
MKVGDVVLVDYTARVKETGRVFDTTYEEVAKKEGIFNPRFKYKPIPIILGSKTILPGVEEKILEMNVGEKKKFVLPPEKAFGKRYETLVKLVPLSEFKKQDIEPYPGMIVTMNNIKGRVISVSGGRVKIDFNHPLAGKEIEYELEIKKKIVKKVEKVKAIVEYLLGVEDVNIDVNNCEVIITFEKNIDVPSSLKERMASMIKRWISGIKKVKFVYVFE